jgi:hypothetical protein
MKMIPSPENIAQKCNGNPERCVNAPERKESVHWYFA